MCPVVVGLGAAVTEVVVPAVPTALAVKGTIANEAMATRTLAPAAKAACLRRLLIIFRLPTSARDLRPLSQSLVHVQSRSITNSDDWTRPIVRQRGQCSQCGQCG